MERRAELPLDLIETFRPDNLSPSRALPPQHIAGLRNCVLKIEQRWDFDRLTADILKSQRRRNLIMRAVSLGRTPAWDFQPFEDATRMYYRGGGNWHEAEERDFLRF